jgi:hypothetical protein
MDLELLRNRKKVSLVPWHHGAKDKTESESLSWKKDVNINYGTNI